MFRSLMCSNKVFEKVLSSCDLSGQAITRSHKCQETPRHKSQNPHSLLHISPRSFPQSYEEIVEKVYKFSTVL